MNTSPDVAVKPTWVPGREAEDKLHVQRFLTPSELD